MLDVTMFSAHQVMGQACETAEYYMANAIEFVHKRFGSAYAEQHPELIVAYMRTSAQDFHTAMMKVAAQDICDALESIASSITAQSEGI